MARTSSDHLPSQASYRLSIGKFSNRKMPVAEEGVSLLGGAPLPLDRDQCLGGGGLLQHRVTQIHIYIYIHTYIHAYIYIYIYMCVYIYIYIYTNNDAKARLKLT